MTAIIWTRPEKERPAERGYNGRRAVNWMNEPHIVPILARQDADLSLSSFWAVCIPAQNPQRIPVSPPPPRSSSPSNNTLPNYFSNSIAKKKFQPYIVS
ncbi:MAG: hypothetical protein ABI171_13080 [Collimonas sp.]|uniref:hypothetical protein n=1 Tax=Collimonas sp. TaxID=1963772 RepID=UPI003265D461